MADFTQIFSKLNEDFSDTMQKDSGEAYGKLSTIFEELGGVLREHFQELMGDEMIAIVKKLNGDDPITEEEKEKIRIWVVGDAEYYANMENNVEDWKLEMKRLMEEINTLQVKDPDVVTSLKLRALFRDASRTLADIFYFKQQKDRVARFEESIQMIDQSERQILAKLLEQKIRFLEF